ncbi:MAG: hypothetical protein EPO16_07420 [Dehalococcoidia bacterium]|nr:MAG: hypothetical protein EPO16_07420 [Dehalococcoidia bacterium]
MTMQLVERADTVRVTAGPFRTFSQIAEFQTTVARLQGVSSARIQSAQRGVLVLDVDYDGLVPLHVRLRELRDARWTQVQAAEDAVEIAVA